jgi:phosphonate transport system substrate-binding protein
MRHRHGKYGRMRRALGAALLLLLTSPAGVGASPEKAVRIRLGLSEALFDDMNENDAKAAVRAWTQSIADASHLEVDGTPQVMRSEDIVHAITFHLIDAFTIMAPDYAKVSRFVDPIMFTDSNYAKNGLEYVLLVPQDSGVHDLGGLRGHSLLVLQRADMCLATPWLETLLASSNLEAPDRFFGRVTRSRKVAQTVLPVFFGSADVCLVTRQAFDTMGELNPQLRQKLRVLAMSPKVVTAMVALHKDSPDETKSRLQAALTGMYDSPGGRQILTLFQSGPLVAVDSSVLRGSLDIIAAYDRLKARRAGAFR